MRDHALNTLHPKVNADAPEEIVPLISSSVMGPLGIRHLPRLWLKILLYASGRLPEGYRQGGGGFDELLTGSPGIDNAGFVAFIENEKPGFCNSKPG